jgi:hypothetical protein
MEMIPPGMSEAGCTVISNGAMSELGLLGSGMEFTIRTGEEPGSPRKGGVSFVLAFRQYLVSCAGHCYTARYLPAIDVDLSDRQR